MYRSHVLVCGGTGCTSSGSQKIRERLVEEIKANQLAIRRLEERVKELETKSNT